MNLPPLGGYVPRVHLSRPDENLMCGDILWDTVGRRHFLLLGFREKEAYDSDEGSIQRMIIIGVPFEGRKPASVFQNFSKKEGWKGEKVRDLPGSGFHAGRRYYKKRGELDDMVSDFGFSEQFFESTGLEAIPLTAEEAELFNEMIDLIWLIREGQPYHGMITQIYEQARGEKSFLHTLEDFGYLHGSRNADFTPMYIAKLVASVRYADQVKAADKLRKDFECFVDVLKFVEKVKWFRDKCYKLKRYESKSFNVKVDALAVLDALVEAGDKDALRMMLSCLTGSYGIDFDYASLSITGVDPEGRFPEDIYRVIATRNIVDPALGQKRSVDEFYDDPLFYDRRPEFPEIPLSIDKPYAMIIEGATGCAKASSGNPCKFCTNTLLEQHFKVVDIGTFTRRLYKIREQLSPEQLGEIRKIFLTGSDLLAIPAEKLKQMLKLISHVFSGSGYGLKIEGFATISSVLKKADELDELREAGLTMLYLGGETGDNQTLDLMNKDQTKEQVIATCWILHEKKIGSSLFFMPGLSGIVGTKRNARETADMIARAQPDYVNVLPLTAPPQECIDAIESTPGNRLMTADEIRAEMMYLVELLKNKGKIWKRHVRLESYDPDLVSKASVTPMVFAAQFDDEGKFHFREGVDGVVREEWL